MASILGKIFGGGDTASTTSSNTETNIDSRAGIEGAEGAVSAQNIEGSNITIQTIDKDIVGKALDTTREVSTDALLINERIAEDAIFETGDISKLAIEESADLSAFTTGESLSLARSVVEEFAGVTELNNESIVALAQEALFSNTNVIEGGFDFLGEQSADNLDFAKIVVENALKSNEEFSDIASKSLSNVSEIFQGSANLAESAIRSAEESNKPESQAVTEKLSRNFTIGLVVISLALLAPTLLKRFK